MAVMNLPDVKTSLINPIVGAKTAINLVRTGISKVTNNGIVPLINNRWVTGNIYDCVFAVSQGLSTMFSGLTDAMGKLDEMQAGITNAMDTIQQFFTVDGVLTNAQGLRNAARSELSSYANSIADWANTTLKNQIDTAAAKAKADAQAAAKVLSDKAQAAADNANRVGVYCLDQINRVGDYASAVARRMDTAEGLITTAKSRVDTIVAKITNIDSTLASAINNLNLLDQREGSFELDILNNRLPQTTAALQAQIDQANQAATAQVAAAKQELQDYANQIAEAKANAALTAANQNLASVRDSLRNSVDGLEIKARSAEEFQSDMRSRVQKLEAQVEKVAPVLARLPNLPAL